MIELVEWGALPSGCPVRLAVVHDGAGASARLSTYGATLTSLRTPDRNGSSDEVVLGFEDLASYLDPRLQREWPYFGSTIGRFANRVAGAAFSIDGRSYPLVPNEGANQNHGGPAGFDRRPWELVDTDGSIVRMRLVSEDGDQGFPGRVEIQIECGFEAPGLFVTRYTAVTDAPTHVSLALHPYFNLAGRSSRSAADHEICVAADNYLPIDGDAIPLAITRVDGSPFDLRRMRALGEILSSDHPQIVASSGLNHCFVLQRNGACAARLEHRASGRRLVLETSAPGLLVYSANAFDGSLTDGRARAFVRHQAVALEAQNFPNSPNRPDFPSTLLRPGETYVSETRFRFSAF